ncbi:MAG: hypothetical protein PHY48_15235, partial [Candidatus Cloacimonetes bacterium]|nr:hypothetical protein [Candidatus Cloacimonadota bacterium]
MIPSFGPNVNTGALSGPMGQHIAQSSMWGLATGSKPFNVGGYEYAWERQKEMNHRLTQFGVDATLAVPGLAAGSLASMAALKFAGRSSALGGAVRAGGMAGSIARGAVGGIPGMAVSLGVDAIAGQWGDAANEYGRDISGIRRMSTRFGNEFTNKESSVVARGMHNYAFNEMKQGTDFDTKLGIDGIRTVATQGMQMNLFQGRKPEELVKQLESAAGVVKFLTGVLGSKDVNETMRYVGQMKNMGINMAQSPQYAMKLGLDAHKYGNAMGVPGSELLGQATQIGANAYSHYGMPSFGGIQPAMQSMALAHEMEKRKILSTAEVAAGGGHNNIAGQMVNFTAGMMNNSGIGKMMLAAGWQGGGKYSMDKMQGALKNGGGYFGAVDSALSGIAGDPDKYADFMMNLENLQASASEQGGLDQQTEDMLFAALDQMGTFKNDNTAAMMLKKIATQEGIQLSTAAAKTIVMKHRRPGMMKAIDREQKRGLNRGFHAQNALEYSPLRGLGRLGESIDKIGPTLKHNLVTRPGQWLHDVWSGVVGEPDENMMGTGAGQFNQYTMDNYNPNMGGPSPNQLKSDDASFNQAFRYGSNALMMGKNPNGDPGTPWWMKSSAANMMPSIEG